MAVFTGVKSSVSVDDGGWCRSEAPSSSLSSSLSSAPAVLREGKSNCGSIANDVDADTAVAGARAGWGCAGGDGRLCIAAFATVGPAIVRGTVVFDAAGVGGADDVEDDANDWWLSSNRWTLAASSSSLSSLASRSRSSVAPTTKRWACGTIEDDDVDNDTAPRAVIGEYNFSGLASADDMKLSLSAPPSPPPLVGDIIDGAAEATEATVAAVCPSSPSTGGSRGLTIAATVAVVAAADAVGVSTAVWTVPGVVGRASVSHEVVEKSPLCSRVGECCPGPPRPPPAPAPPPAIG